MGLRINNNIDAFNAHRNLMMTSLSLSRSMQRLSSGLRINSAADDAAGLAISERMRGQISGIQMAQRNAQDGIGLVQTAEGSLQQATSILHRIRDLAVQFNNGTLDAASQAAITGEVNQLNQELTRLVGAAEYNGIPVLGGTPGGIMVTLQVGPNNGDTLVINNLDIPTSLGTAVTDFVTNGNADLTAIDGALNAISRDRGTFGAIQNRLEYTVNSLSIYQENLTAAESRIRDLDMAAEMTNFTRLQILQQSGTAMLAQANMTSQSILSLMR